MKVGIFNHRNNLNYPTPSPALYAIANLQFGGASNLNNIIRQLFRPIRVALMLANAKYMHLTSHRVTC